MVGKQHTYLLIKIINLPYGELLVSSNANYALSVLPTSICLLRDIVQKYHKKSNSNDKQRFDAPEIYIVINSTSINRTTYTIVQKNVEVRQVHSVQCSAVHYILPHAKLYLTHYKIS